LIGAVSLPALQAGEPEANSAPRPCGAPRRATWIVVAVGLAGNVVFFTGVGSIWPLMVRLASNINVPLSTAAKILGGATLAGIVGALFAAWLALRYSRRTLLSGGTVLIVASVVALGNARDAVSFACSTMLFMGSWIFLVPPYVSILALADRLGRAAAFAMATQYGGLALGPILAALISGNGQYSPALVLGGSLAVFAALLMVYADRVIAT